MNEAHDHGVSEIVKVTQKSAKKNVIESKSKAGGKYKKAPGAPRRFKSAFIFFSTEKHKEIRQGLGLDGAKEKTTNVAKMVSEAWKSLSSEDREIWEEKASRDKARYEVEKQTYNGPWKVAADKRSPKDPNAPKRPMSAFLSFSNCKRAAVKRQNQSVSNAEVSRILSRMWKDAPEDDRQMHIDQEFKLRQEYKSAMGEWRTNAEREKRNARLSREDIAIKTLEAQKQQMMEGDNVGILRQQGDVDDAEQSDHAAAIAMFQEYPSYGRGMNHRYYDQGYGQYEHVQHEGVGPGVYSGMHQSLSELNASSQYHNSLPGASGMLDRQYRSNLQQHPSQLALQWAQRDSLSSQFPTLAYGGSQGAVNPYSNVNDATFNAYAGYQNQRSTNPYPSGHHQFPGYDQLDGDHSRTNDTIRNLFGGHFQG